MELPHAGPFSATFGKKVYIDNSSTKVKYILAQIFSKGDNMSRAVDILCLFAYPLTNALCLFAGTTERRPYSEALIISFGTFFDIYV